MALLAVGALPEPDRLRLVKPVLRPLRVPFFNGIDAVEQQLAAGQGLSRASASETSASGA